MRRAAGVLPLAVVWSTLSACEGTLDAGPSAGTGASTCTAGSSVGQGGSSPGSGGPPAVDGGSTDAGVSVDAAADSAGAIPTCLPNFVHGPLISEDAAHGIHVYKACGGKKVVILLDGSKPVSTMDQVTALYMPLVEPAYAIPGIVDFGTGVCCTSSLDGPACFNLQLDRHGTPLNELPAKLAAIVNDDVCVAFVVEQTGFEGPRCKASSPTCIPQPYCPDKLDSTLCCPKNVSYDARRPRTPVYANVSAGACTYDGECYLGVNSCSAYTDIFYPVARPACYLDLNDALCGCVDGRCQWFVQ